MKRKLNGQGSIRVLEPGKKYRMRKQVGYLENGHPRILTVTGTSETDCYRRMRNKEAELEKEQGLCNNDAVKRITVKELCLKHLQEHTSEKGRLKPKSVDRRECTINNHVGKSTIGSFQAISVTPHDVNMHIEELIDKEFSVSTVEKSFNVINSAYKWAIDQGYLTYNPCDAVREKIKNRLRSLEKRDSSDGVVVVMSEKQVELIKRYIKENKDSWEMYYYLLALSVLFLLYTGMRVGELCALRWKDWNSEYGTIDINKTRNIVKHRNEDNSYKPNENSVKNYHARTIALSDEAKVIIEEMYKVSSKKEKEDYILINRSLNPSNPSNYDRNIKCFYKAVGFSDEISGAHILRRTCATKLHNEGARVEDIAAYLGDTPETIIKHYISLTKKIIADGVVLNVVNLPMKKIDNKG